MSIFESARKVCELRHVRNDGPGESIAFQQALNDLEAFVRGEYVGLSVLQDALALQRKQIEEIEAERDKYRTELATATKFLLEGKYRFAPHTTNSDVDFFLDRMKDLAGKEPKP